MANGIIVPINGNEPIKGLLSSDNLNTIIDSFGMYNWGSMPSNAPTSYATMLVFGGGYYGTTQLVSSMTASYIRSYNPENQSWTAWKTIAP